MIEVTLVSGFLGAGKTTWLEQRLRDEPDAADVLLVNDFADAGVDTRTLWNAVRGVGVLVEEIVGGCACCDRLDDLRSTLLRLVERRHRETGRESLHVIVETSGLARPHRVVRLLTDDPVLRLNVALRDLVVVIDSIGGRRLLRHRAAARAQIGLADRVVLARSDLADSADLDRLAATVRGLNASCVVVAADHGAETPVKATPLAKAERYDDELDSAAPLRSWTTTLCPGTSWAEYALWLHSVCRAHPEGLLRSKGVVPAADGHLLVQSMGPDISLPVPAEPGHGTSMVFVLSGLKPADLARSLAAFVPSATA
ncbi:CobW family GTP-binding protein [Streptomyces sp. NPDC059718]